MKSERNSFTRRTKVLLLLTLLVLLVTYGFLLLTHGIVKIYNFEKVYFGVLGLISGGLLLFIMIGMHMENLPEI